MNFLKLALTLIASLFLFFQTVDAATVKAVKKKRVLITLEGDEAKKGQLFYAISKSGKRRAILRIQKVKGNKAIARIVKGKARKGYEVVPREAGSKETRKTRTAKRSDSDSDEVQSYWGFQAGFISHSLDAKITQADNTTVLDATPTGSAFNLTAHYDYPVFDQLWFRGIFGWESLDVTSTEEVCTSAACTAKISYLALTAAGRYLFSLGTFRPWVGAGVAFLFSISKDSNFLNTSSSNYVPISVGFDYMLSSGKAITFSIESDQYADSPTVTATASGGRIGMSFPF